MEWKRDVQEREYHSLHCRGLRTHLEVKPDWRLSVPVITAGRLRQNRAGCDGRVRKCGKA